MMSLISEPKTPEPAEAKSLVAAPKTPPKGPPLLGQGRLETGYTR